MGWWQLCLGLGGRSTALLALRVFPGMWQTYQDRMGKGRAGQGPSGSLCRGPHWGHWGQHGGHEGISSLLPKITAAHLGVR